MNIVQDDILDMLEGLSTSLLEDPEETPGAGYILPTLTAVAQDIGTALVPYTPQIPEVVAQVVGPALTPLVPLIPLPRTMGRHLFTPEEATAFEVVRQNLYETFPVNIRRAIEGVEQGVHLMNQPVVVSYLDRMRLGWVPHYLRLLMTYAEMFYRRGIRNLYAGNPTVRRMLDQQSVFFTIMFYDMIKTILRKADDYLSSIPNDLYEWLTSSWSTKDSPIGEAPETSQSLPIPYQSTGYDTEESMSGQRMIDAGKKLTAKIKSLKSYLIELNKVNPWTNSARNSRLGQL